ncbi:hypothetical protein RKE29_19215 [Streptomyces sp. B1866]|uniref:hypothetical protein n=1 Tax=Streptomyces sp. B1866 TaxID=3075431 RepID=UPI00288D6622|nr:hypothetical protein [Streptomyces sp. B1866]MDT3398749.1 hypothetical protein [Streptomyces sp. B1866]
MISDALRAQAADFAKEIQSLLNRTICGNVQIRALAWRSPEVGRVFVVGHRVSKQSLVPERFQVHTGKGRSCGWMSASSYGWTTRVSI